jgi:metal-responsive CopG/Arc/MetJ family transcriptional regulator
MDLPKLYIEQKRYTGESTVVSVRMPRDMLDDLDSIAKRTGRTRSEIISLCLEFAVKQIEVIENQQTEKERK